MRLMQFHFKKVNHVPGKELHTEAALSRMRGDTQVTVPQKEMNIYTNGKLDTLPVSDFRQAEIKETQHEEPVCKEIKIYCTEGWPDKFYLHCASNYIRQLKESSV